MKELSLAAALERIRPIDAEKLAEVQARIDLQTKPRGSLGRLEELARRYVAITGREDIRKKAVFTFAADHGVAAEGVSAFPQEVTRQMVLNFLDGGAGINALARHAGADVIVVDMGVDADFEALPGLLSRKIGRGTRNFSQEPAMTREQAVQSLETGISLAFSSLDSGIDLVGTGEMGIANTTAASAICAAMTGLPVDQVTHRGTGIDDRTLDNKIAVIRRALDGRRPDPQDPVDVLAKVGGFEIGGIAGLIVGCAAAGIPVIVDGFISTAGAVIASELHPQIREYLFAAHRSVEIGHVHLLEKMGLRPILQLDMRLGEGTGAALAMTIFEASLRALREVATFESAGVSRGERE